MTKTRVSLDKIAKTVLLLGITDIPPFQDDSEILWYLSENEIIRIVVEEDNTFVSTYQKNGDVISQTKTKNCLDILKHVDKYFQTTNIEEGENRLS